MRIFKYEAGKKIALGDTAVALGCFDGLHLGHRELIKVARRLADARSLPLVVFTFDFDGAMKGGTRLYSDDTKAELLASLGVENIVSASFSSLSSMSAEDFISQTLRCDLSARLAVSGDDFRFGAQRMGDIALLRERLRASGADFAAVPPVLSAKGEKISTAAIKRCLREGDVRTAAELLGEPYFISGAVERGRGVGRTMDMPTVNLSLPRGAEFIRRGVYATEVEIAGKFYTGVTNIGICPTFSLRDVHAETLILDFGAEIYGEKITVRLVEFLREERRFESPEALREQVRHDSVLAREIISS